MNPTETVTSNEEQLSAEIEGLSASWTSRKPHGRPFRAGAPGAAIRRKNLGALSHGRGRCSRRPSLLDYIPHQRRAIATSRGSRCHRRKALPRSRGIAVAQRGAIRRCWCLPGNIQAVTEAPILARAEGYSCNARGYRRPRDRPASSWRKSKLPDLDQQVRQAQAAVEQVQADLERTPRRAGARPGQ